MRKSIGFHLAALLPALLSTFAYSNTIPVDSTTSTVTGDGLCSLIEAIENANQDREINTDCPAGRGADVLELSPEFNYVFSTAYGGTSNALPIITDDLSIEGAGATIRRSVFSTESFRLLQFDDGNHALSDLTLTGGVSAASMIGGGAILATDATLALNGVQVSGNSAEGQSALGGALRLDNSTVEINDSLLQSNRASSSSLLAGGGAIAQFNGSLEINRSALLSNDANESGDSRGSPCVSRGTGGALRIEATASPGASATFNDSTIASNQGRLGGGIHLLARQDTGVAGSDVLVQLYRSTLVLNRANGCNGAARGDGIFVEESGGGSGLATYGSSIVLGNGRFDFGLDMIVGNDCESDDPFLTFNSFDGNVLDANGDCTFQFDAFSADYRGVIDPFRVDNHHLPLRTGPAVDLPEANFNCNLAVFDAFGNPRAGGPGMGGSICDAGAVELQYPTVEFSLQTALSGTGDGRISSNPAGIDCPNICSAIYPADALVTLTAAPASGSVFAGWSGDCSGTGTCQVTMNQMRSVSARFEPEPVTLNVLLDTPGAAGGRVISSPAGIDCPGDCTQDFPIDTVVTLTATPDVRSDFLDWGNVCDKFGDVEQCTISMFTDLSAIAIFIEVATDNELSTHVTGPGRLTSSPEGIDCPGQCSFSFSPDTVVQLTATPDAGAAFQNFTGDCSGATCELTMGEPFSVGAVFIDQDVLFSDGFE